MPQHESEILASVARAIADGRPIAWDEIAAESPDLRKRLDNLHAIQTLASSSEERFMRSGGSAIEEPSEGRVCVTPPRVALFRWGKLEVLERIGEGSFGEVFRAFDPILEREVALKLRRRSRARSARDASDAGSHLEEARRLARVRHANVLTVHGIEEHGGREGMWTDYIRGRTLEAIVVEDGPLPAGEIERIGRDLCAALGAVHDAGLAHGDVKPANVMREDSGRIVLMDFGAGSNLRRRIGSKPAGPAAGTPLVMAPELFAGGSPSPAADMYAAGVLLYRLATGRYPVTAKTRRALVAELRKGTPVPVSESRPDLPPHLIEVIERSLRTRPEDRYPSAAAMCAALDAGDSGPAVPAAPSPHLPREATRFIGRERELREARRLVLRHRLVTLTGAGGSGKTRLALRVATGLADAFRDGARWIELAPLTAAGRLAAAIAHAAGVREEPRRDIAETLIESLRGRAMLLVLDNCEHLSGEVSLLSVRLLDACPDLHVLVTSRGELGVLEETVFPLGPLPTPMRPGIGEPEGVEISRVESVRLFLDRACAARPDFVLTPGNAPAVARICRRVEGIPLAIGLAAARVRAMGVEQIAARLEESFRVLAGGGDEGLPHHKTIQASIDWSYQLLDPAEQTVLRRLALFAGPWSLEAAESVCASPVPGSSEQTPPPDDGEAFEAILSLVDKSLVLYNPVERDGGGEPAGSYQMLEMVRAFARERLLPGEERAVRERQASYYARLTERARADLVPPKEEAWFDRFELEHGNLLDLLDWCCRSPGFADVGMRIAIVLRRFWLIRGYWREGREVLEALLRAGGGSPEVTAKALHAAASVAVVQSDYEGTARLGNEALTKMRELGDRKGTAQMLSILGIMAIDQAQFDLAKARIEEALAIDREIGNTAVIPQRLSNLGTLAARTGDFTGAARRFEEALTLFRAAGDLRSAAVTIGNLSTTCRNLGDYERARELAEEHLALTRAVGSKVEIAASLRTLGLALVEGNDLPGAKRNLVEALQLERGMENRVQVVWCLEAMARLLHVSGDVQAAVRLMGATEAVRHQLGTPQPEPDRLVRRQALADLEQRLGAATVTALLDAGRSMSLEEAMEFAGRERGATA